MLSLKIRDMTLWTGSKKELLERLTKITLENLENENFGGVQLAVHAGMSVSTLNRRLHKISSKTPNQFIREVRLKRAMELLMGQSDTAAEVAWKVGFGSPAYFSKCFHDFYGFPPGEARRRMEEGSLTGPDKTRLLVNASKNVSFVFARHRKFYLISFTVVGLILLIIGMVVFFLPEKKGETGNQPFAIKPSIAVLPFKNLSSEDGSQFLVDGIMEEILNQLFHIGDITVVSRTTSESYRDSNLPTIEIARLMGVDYLLEGSVRRQGNYVRISVQLIDGKTDWHLWSENYDRKLTDVFYIQGEIAKNISGKLEVIIFPQDSTLINKMSSRDIDLHNY